MIFAMPLKPSFAACPGTTGTVLVLVDNLLIPSPNPLRATEAEVDDAALQEMLWQPRGKFGGWVSTQHTEMLIPQDRKTLNTIPQIPPTLDTLRQIRIPNRFFVLIDLELFFN